ncbi:glycoside hydrolase family 88/105 protein [Parasphaerochaeta coccoides]|uniref:Glycosyl hydrolase family 88 n=1 Tax=Parasphaerochaeta coccoides (strain ATCC BAA-1237 / DSM 17374 / SPN1) TaxID=760011 RepID=F4GJ06_PARC1|nr:glycoside hydrolase family 88 protein [Parasphaerochaeta coccoides]AEC01301.1 glycosyl hydrolase family 88 [Parasphaerochaeta coccoides DSM 17374]
MKSESSQLLSVRMADSVRSRYLPGMMVWHYEHGLVIRAVAEVGERIGDPSFFDWAHAMYSPLVSEDGTIATYRHGEYNLDQIQAGRFLFALHDRTREKRFLLAAEKLKGQLRSQPRTLTGIFWHKEIYPWQVWLDGLYMQGPFNALYAVRNNDQGALDDLVEQMVKTSRILRDGKTGLLFHAWDESRGQRWSSPDTGLSPHIWGRALGWFIMAVIDVIGILPPGHAGRVRLEALVPGLLDPVLACQTFAGLWWQVMDVGERDGNYLETSGSAMFTYALQRAASLGLASDTARYLAAADKALDALVRTRLREEPSGELHLGGICSVAGLGGNPYRDGSFPYYIKEPVVEDDFKGVGPFILALVEQEKRRTML